MLLPIILIILLGVWYLLLGKYLLRCWGFIPANNIGHISISIALGYGLAGYIVFILGVLEILTKPVLGIVIAATPPLLGNDIRWLYQAISETVRRLNLNFKESCLIAFLGIFVIFSLVTASSPPVGGDEYHKVLVRMFAEQGAITNVIDIPYSNFPMLAEMPMVLGAVLQSDILAQLHGFLLGLMSLGLVYSIARLFSSKWVSMWSALICYSTVVVFEMTRAMRNDIGTATFVLAGVYVIVALCSDTQWKKELVLSGLLFGAAAASKLTAAEYSIAMTLVIFFFLLIKKRKGLKNALIVSTIFAILAFLVVFPWFIRSYINTGNPVHPYYAKLFHAENDWWTFDASEAELTAIRNFVNIDKDPLSFILIPWIVTIHPDRLRCSLWICPLLLTFIPFCGYRSLCNVEKWILTFCCISGIIWFFIHPLIRLGFPIYALLCIFAANGLVNAYQNALKLRKLVIALTVICALSLQFAGAFYHSISSLAYAAGGLSEDQYLSREFAKLTSYPYYSDDVWMKHHLNKDAVVLSHYWQMSGGYYRSRKTLSFVTLKTIMKASGEPLCAITFMCAMAKQRITHVFIDEEQHDFPVIYRIIKELEKSGGLKVIYKRSGLFKRGDSMVKVLEVVDG